MPEDRPQRRFAEHIVQVLRDHGHLAYFAGGCVRDELLGREPDDYDVATDAKPDRIAALFPRTAEVGAHFGVVLVKHGHAAVEVATFRTDGSYSDRRRPDSVSFSSPKEDATRRDFTVNALFLDPFGPTPGMPRGTVVDFVGGLADLSAGLLRAVGDPEKRLAEDHLRALRAARLAAKLGFEIERGTAAAIRRHAADLAGVSRERIGEEVRNMMEHPSRAIAAGWVEELGLTGTVLGAREREPRGEGPPGLLHHPVLAALPVRSGVPLALAAWALDLGDSYRTDAEQTAARWRASLCLSNSEHAEFRATLMQLARLETDWLTLPMAKQKRLAAKPGFENAMVLLGVRDAARGAAVRARVAELAACFGGISPMPLVTGDHLVAKGLLPGPRFKTILDAMYDAQLEGRIATVEQAWALARDMGFG